MDTALHPRRLQSSTITMIQLQKLLEQSSEQQKMMILNGQTEFVTISCGYLKIQEQ
jgi:hypothetical protein